MSNFLKSNIMGEQMKTETLKQKLQKSIEKHHKNRHARNRNYGLVLLILSSVNFLVFSGPSAKEAVEHSYLFSGYEPFSLNVGLVMSSLIAILGAMLLFLSLTSSRDIGDAVLSFVGLFCYWAAAYFAIYGGLSSRLQ